MTRKPRVVLVESSPQRDEAEARVLAALRAGDEDALRTIVSAHGDALCTYAEILTRARETAEEIVQDVFFGIWRRRSDLVITSSLRHYLYRAVRNRARNAARHGKSVARIASLAALDIVAAHDADPAPTVEESLQFQELSAAIHEAIDQLPAASRSAYALRWEGWSYTEIAQALGISVKNVETRIGRALRILRTTLGHLR